MEIKINKLHKSAILPTRANDSDAGYDLYAIQDMIVGPMDKAIIVPTGISIEIPKGYYGRVAPRSGLAVKNGIDVLAGVIDSGYRGEIGVVLMNLNLPEILFNNNRKARPMNPHLVQKINFRFQRGIGSLNLLLRNVMIFNGLKVI